jgi:hypothetical protein
VVATTARYGQKAGSARELAEVSHNLRLALSVQVVVGTPGSKQCTNYVTLVTLLSKPIFLKIMVFVELL